MTQATLCFLLRDDEILLAMKKRGFGRGRWNGTGGKAEPGEPLIEAVVRETKEEIQVRPQELAKVAELNFYLHRERAEKANDFYVEVYFCRQWEGEPVETEEMAPKWFKTDDLPYDEMWDDDRYWLPKVLAGQQIVADVTFTKDDKVITYTDRPLDKTAK